VASFELRIISDEEVRSNLKINDAIEAIEQAYIEYSQGNARNLPRSTIETKEGIFRSMSACIPGMGVVGSKQGFWASEYKGKKELAMSSEIISLYDLHSGRILALINSHYINQIRTGAVGAISVKYLSNENASTVGVIGSGLHARTQILGTCAVRDVEKIKVYSRNKEKREEFCKQVSSEIGKDVIPVDSAEDAITNSQIILEATTSRTPVVNGKYISEGCHICSVSSGYLGARQLDDATISKANVVSVDSRDQVLVDGTGDILAPITAGIINWKNIVEIADIVSRKLPGRLNSRDITIFKSCGMALSDVATGKKIFDICSQTARPV
jgi:ornithine cyclodeaminase/alanine dehydrogenase-like protein (mu-crystallin family)